MVYMRNMEERQAAIDRLKQNKEKCNQYNLFGEDNHQHIDIMIDVIEEDKSEEWIYDTYPGCNKLGKFDSKEHSKWVTAINARDYLRGKLELDDLLYPEN